MIQRNKKLVMFDFDGVLVNTTEMSYQIHKIKNKDLTWERFQEYASGNIFTGLFKAIEEGRHIPSDDFAGEYKKRLAMFTIHDIMHEVILSLAVKYRLVIISSTFSSSIIEFLKRENISECFSDVLGCDTHMSKVIKIKLMLEKYSVLPRDSVFITDTLGDIKEAHECVVPSIGVTWGLHTKEMLEKGNPTAVIDDPIILVPTIENVLK
jgi:phosphoglycolate phosphatase-like HAD superfamily hydrolase